jgi:AraC-like DNA-binding protein
MSSRGTHGTSTRQSGLRRLLEAIDVLGSVGWADKAAELGWCDQAHLIRDFKRHTGVTPSEYLAAQRSTYDRTEASTSAGFVPEVVKFVQTNMASRSAMWG